MDKEDWGSEPRDVYGMVLGWSKPLVRHPGGGP